MGSQRNHQKRKGKSEVPMESAISCKKRTKKRSDFQEKEAKSNESNKISRTMNACIVEAHESTRQRLESSVPKNLENHIAGKRYNSMSHDSLMARSMDQNW